MDILMVASSIWFTIVVCVLFLDELESATLNSFSLEPGNVAEKNSEIKMICSVTISSSDGILSLAVYKGAQTGTEQIATCTIYTGSNLPCTRQTAILPRYDVTYTQQALVVTISNLEISDRGNWYCGFNGQPNIEYVLPVYLSPVGLAFDGGSAGGDLAATGVTLNCKTTTCVFPAPAEFQWFYKKTNSQWLSYTTTSVAGSQGSCSGEERIYSTTLSLPRYTTCPLQPPNVDTTVALQCRMEFVTLTSALQTGQTGDVIYAVQVSSVTLRDGNTLPTNSSTITVTSSLSKTLTCSPSLSRPDSTVVWYIGGVEKQRSNTNTNYVFTPTNNDHNKQIYCKAYNFQSESQAVYSYKPVLYVKVQVSTITLRDDATTPSTNDRMEVTENLSRTLTCDISTSRPLATIVWYIGNAEKQRTIDTQLTFTPANDNHDKPIFCEAFNIQPETQALQSNKPKLYVRVQVSNVTLRDGNTLPTNSSTITVTSSLSKTLTCSPSLSRPDSTVVWYIGGVEKQRSNTNTSYVFTPTNNDHNKQIYCKAYNFQSESQAVYSYKPVLYVRVQVTSVTLKRSTTTVTTDTIQVTDSQSETLTCTASTSRPAATIVWFIGEVEKKRSNTFTFVPTNDDHNKQIYCKAFNLQAENNAVSSNKPRLYVRVPAGVPTLTNKTSGNLILMSGDIVTLECLSTQTRPVVMLTWKIGTTTLNTVQNTNIAGTGGLVAVSSVVTFTPSNSDNGKIVYCETYISRQNNPPQVEQAITVWWPPSRPSIVTVTPLPWLEGQTGRWLKCNSNDDGNPDAEVSWDPQIGTASTSDATKVNLTTLTPQHNDLSTTCQLSNNYTRRKNSQVKSSQKTLNVEFYPIVTTLVDNKNVESVTRNEGQTLTAVCSAIGNPQPTSHWLTENPTSDQIVFADIDRTDDKVYTCYSSASSSKYGKLERNKDLTIIVNYAPVVTVNPLGDLQENKTLKIQCNAVGRPQTYSYSTLTQTWKGSTIRNIDIPTNGVVDLQNAVLQDSGNYTCHVNNGIEDRSSVLVQVGTNEAIIEVAPKVFQKIPTFAGASGESINITVPFYSYPAVNSVNFLLNGTYNVNSSKYRVSYAPVVVTTDDFLDIHQMPVELDGYHAVLYIADQEEADFTAYSLELNNNIATTIWNFTHTSKSSPRPPKSFMYTGSVNNIPTFILLGGFNGGAEQTFIIQTAVVGTENWIEQMRFNDTDGTYRQLNGSHIFNITGLSTNSYSVRVLAENAYGQLDEMAALSVQITVENPAPPEGPPIGAIVGGLGAAVFVIIIIVVAMIIWKRRSPKQGLSSTELNGRVEDAGDDNSDDLVVTENECYVSGDYVAKTTKFCASDENVYAQSMKGRGACGETDVEYSVVQKRKEDPSNIYAMPDKKGKQEKKVNGKKGFFKDKKPKNAEPEGDIYENAPEFKDKNAEASASKPNGETIHEDPVQKKNKEGLIYADLEFNDQLKGQKKLVIHGLDDMTIYGEVDFTKKADPLPDSDDESSPPKN